MVKNFLIGTPHEFQIFTDNRFFLGYDSSIHEQGVFSHALMLGFITICWGVWEGETEDR